MPATNKDVDPLLCHLRIEAWENVKLQLSGTDSPMSNDFPLMIKSLNWDTSLPKVQRLDLTLINCNYLTKADATAIVRVMSISQDPYFCPILTSSIF